MIRNKNKNIKYNLNKINSNNDDNLPDTLIEALYTTDSKYSFFL